MKINKRYWITEKGDIHEAKRLAGRGWGMDLDSYLARWKNPGEAKVCTGYEVMESAMEEHMRKMRW